MKDPVISLKDLFAECVRKSMFIIACTVVCAVALCGVKYVKDVRSTNITQETAKVEFSVIQKQQINSYVIVTLQREGLMKYFDESVYINLNPYDIDCVLIQYRVDADSETVQKDAVFALRSYALNGGLAADLNQKDSSIDAKYFAELVKCDSMSQESYISNGVVELMIYADSKETAQTYAAWVNECVETYFTKINNSGVAGRLEKISEQYTTLVDKEFVEYRDEKILEYETLSSLLTDLSATLSSEQMAAANQMLNNEVDEDGQEIEVVSPGISFKWLVLGGVLGCVLAIALIAIKYIFTNNIKRSTEIQEMFGITSLGHLNNRKLTVWDNLANKIFYPTECFDLETQKTNAISKISFCCNRNEANHVYVVDNGCSNVSLLSDITAGLASNNIQSKVVEQLTAQEDASKVKYVVLVNQIGKTKYQDVENELLFCKSQNIQVLGYITVK